MSLLHESAREMRGVACDLGRVSRRTGSICCLLLPRGADDRVVWEVEWGFVVNRDGLVSAGFGGFLCSGFLLRTLGLNANKGYVISS